SPLPCHRGNRQNRAALLERFASLIKRRSPYRAGADRVRAARSPGPIRGRLPGRQVGGTGTAFPPWLLLPDLLKIVKENAVADSGRIFGLRHLESHPPAIVAYHGIGSLVAGKIAEISQTLGPTAAVQRQLPYVHVPRPLAILPITLHARVLAVRKNAL